MIKCPNCGRDLPDGTGFCDKCGAKISAGRCCPRCGEPISGDYDFCIKCGAPLKQPAAAAAQEPAPAPAPVPAENVPAPSNVTEETAKPAPARTKAEEHAEAAPERQDKPAPEAAGSGSTPVPAGPAPVQSPAADNGVRPNYAPTPVEQPAPAVAPAPAPSVQPGYTPAPSVDPTAAAGAPVRIAAPAQPNYIPAPVQQFEPAGPRKSKKGKIFLFGGIGLAVVAAAVVAVILIFFRGGGKAEQRALYVKDDELWFAEPSGKNKGEITEDLFAGSDPTEYTSDVFARDLTDTLSACIQYSADGKLMFYPDRVDYYEGFTLYCRDTGMKKEPVKIDTGVVRFYINDAGNKVIYLKDSKLYVHNLKDKERIASDVWDVMVSENLERVGYMTDDGGYYVWSEKNGSEKVVGDLDYICGYSKDLSTVWFVRDEGLYRQTMGEDRVKIDSDIASVLNVYDTGEIYYTKSESIDRPLSYFVEDDLAMSDSMIYEPSEPILPDEPEYPYFWDFDTYEEYEAALEQYDAAYEAYAEEYDRLYDEYAAAYDVYYEKLYRDSLRSDLEMNTISVTESSLYYYNGSETSEIATGLVSPWDNYAMDDAPVAAFFRYESEEMPTYMFSEIESVSDL